MPKFVGAKPNEVFIGNMDSKNGHPVCIPDYLAELKTIRLGEQALDIDGNKLNNDPANLEVLPSQSEHCKVHGFGKKKGR